MNPLAGVFFHWLGGLSCASFYVPYKKIKLWSWEIFWLTGGVFSWLVMPWLVASIGTNDLIGVLGETPRTTWLWCWFWGVLWGLGGLTFGLTLRYLGMSLGMAVALGFTTVVGTMGPPIFHGQLGALTSHLSGQFTAFGILMTLVGIAIVAAAGRSKANELGDEAKDGVVEFNLGKGLAVAVFSGVMSGCFAWGLAAGDPVRSLSLASGTNPLWQGLPVLCLVLLGGFTTNFIWCLILILKNRSAAELIGRPRLADTEAAQRPPLAANYLLAAFGGTLWYFQFFFYSMGESQMGEYGFSSWTLHMASIILFSTLWGFALGEWKRASGKTKRLVWLGIGMLVASTMVIGVGNYLGTETGH